MATTPAWDSNFDQHFNQLLSEESVASLDEFHKTLNNNRNISISQIRWPKIGFLSLMKPMIDENKGNEEMDCLKQEHNLSGYKLNEAQLELYGLLKSYKDLLYTNESIESLDDIQTVYALHALNHMKNVRAQIVKNNKTIEQQKGGNIDDDDSIRDQGYTRARVLFLLPFRHSALRLCKCMVDLLGENYNFANYDRLVKEFGNDGSDSTALKPISNEGNSKPMDFYQIFHGNTDDAFKVGLKLTKKSLKFFSDFYDSDIIIASPLGLKTILSPGEQDAASMEIDDESEPVTTTNTGGEHDFLSSLEIVILDQADIFLMQNWEHILDILNLINNPPAKIRQTDISRVRLWNLENWSKYYRQLIMFSSISVPLVHSFFQTKSLNYEGYLTLKHRVDKPQAKLIIGDYKQEFIYYDSKDAKDAADARFNFFTGQLLKNFIGISQNSDDNNAIEGTQSAIDHVLIVVSSYFDYVRLRNYFRREKLSFTQICEYTEENKKAKARQLFYFGARQFLIYTERCHFYHRYKIKGIRRIIFYEPPMFAKFYSELVKMMTPKLQGKKFNESEIQFTVTTLFTNHDTLQLGAIVGYSNACRLIQNKKSIT